MSPSINDLNVPQFSSAEACIAAGIDSATLKNWLSRKPSAVFVGAEERFESGDKVFFKFTLRRVLQIAVTSELVAIGLSPRTASMAAARFTDSGAGRLPGRPARMPGELFAEDYTFLVSRAESASVVNAKKTTIGSIAFNVAGGQSAVTIMNLNQIDRRVRTSLGLPVTDRNGVA